MARYIELDALVAKIEKLKENANKRGAIGKVSTIVLCNELLSFLDTLEVKDIDDEPDCMIFPRPAGCYSTCKECPYSVINNKVQKG